LGVVCFHVNSKMASSSSAAAAPDVIVVESDEDSLAIVSTGADDPGAGSCLTDWPGRQTEQERWLLEMFMPPRVGPHFRHGGGHSLSKDMLCGWNADLWEDRGAMLRWVDTTRPAVVIACPPCTMYSSLQRTNKRKIGEGRWDEKMKVAAVYLKFAMLVCKMQAQRGDGFVFEHPETASSWADSDVASVAALDGVKQVTFDQCRFDLMLPSGEKMKKPTRLMTNMSSVLFEFHDRRCNCIAAHHPVQGRSGGVSVSKHSQVYPPKMVLGLARASLAHVNL
jgi:hypothetical protein